MSRRELHDLAAAQMVTPAEIDKGCDELTRADLARDVDGRLTLRE